VLLVGLGLSLVAFFSVRDNDRKSERPAFEEAAQVDVAAIRIALDRSLESLENGGTLIDSSSHITAEQFSAFGERALARNPALKAVGWQPRVMAKDREAFESEIGKDIPGFEIKAMNEQFQMARSPEREEYFPVLYSVDRDGASPFGLDIASRPHARELLIRSAVSGDDAASGKVQLVTGAQGKAGFVLYRPVYKIGALHDTDERRRLNLVGFATSVIAISAQINGVLERIGAPNVQVSLYDQSAPAAKEFLAVWPQLVQQDPGVLHKIPGQNPLESRAVIEVGGRQWLAVMTSSDGHFATDSPWRSWGRLAIGIAFSILLAFYLESIRRYARNAHQRTEELEAALHDNEKIGRELRAAQSELLATARQAGMAEIANNVLHNVGNVLNSVNVSAGLIGSTMRDSKAHGLAKAVHLMNEHSADLGDFLTRDEKGKLLPGYLNKAVAALALEQQSVVEELGSLAKSVDHIKDIVATQQSYAGAASVVEAVQIRDLMEDALRMNVGAMTRHRVTVVKEFEDVPLLLLDKSRVLQILVNLISNAKQAMDGVLDRAHRMTLRVDVAGLADERRLGIRVEDNGEGIPPENLPQLFVHGFTTRKDGHGFGLHSCALTAKEMGGTLTANSDGPGKGATFTLELPIRSIAEPITPIAPVLKQDPVRSLADPAIV
jgi:signal transduction histidine kinase